MGSFTETCNDIDPEKNYKHLTYRGGRFLWYPVDFLQTIGANKIKYYHSKHGGDPMKLQLT